MSYIPDDPEEGEAYVIPLIEKCPKLRAVFEAIRHGSLAPEFTDSETDSEPSRVRTKSFTSSEASKPSSKRAVNPFQHTVLPLTDAECGLPSATSAALSDIPADRLPLSRTLAASQKAIVIEGYPRLEFAESLAHAMNLRRATGRARAVLVIVSSERAVKEWVAAMCQILDEVHIISYSRVRSKREAIDVQLRQSQYPGIIVAAEKSLQNGAQDLWDALRDNRIAKKWELVVSESVSDRTLLSNISPLCMVRDGLAEKGVILARKSLTKLKTSAAVSEVPGVDGSKEFWMKRDDVQKFALEESRKEDLDSTALVETSKRGKGKTTRSRRSRSTSVGKENHFVPDNSRAESESKHGPTTTVAKSPVVVKSKRKESDSKRKRRRSRSRSSASKDLSSQLDIHTPAAPSSRATRRASRGITKSRKQADSNPHAVAVKVATPHLEQGAVDEESVFARKSKSKASKEISHGPTKKATRKCWVSDSLRESLRTESADLHGNKSASRKALFPQDVKDPEAPRRRSSKLSQKHSSKETPVILAHGKSGPKKQRDKELDSERELAVSTPTKRKKRKSSPVSSTGCLGLDEEGESISKMEGRAKIKLPQARKGYQIKAQAKPMSSSEFNDSSEEKFYTPPSRGPSLASSDSTPQKFFSPRTSFSPNILKGSGSIRKQKSKKVPAFQIPLHRNSSSPKPNVHRKTDLNHRIALSDVRRSSPLSHSPLRTDRERKESEVLACFNDSSSDDQPLGRTLREIQRKNERQIDKALSIQQTAVTDVRPRRRISLATKKNKSTSLGGPSVPEGQEGACLKRRVNRSKRRSGSSVFEGMLSSEVLAAKASEPGLKRTKSLPAKVHVKHEGDPAPRTKSSLILPPESPRYNAPRTVRSRGLSPHSSPDTPIHPEQVKMSNRSKTSHKASTRPQNFDHLGQPTKRSSRVRQKSSIRNNDTHSPLETPESNPPDVDVIVISSESEDERTPQERAVSKKRRILDGKKANRDLRDVPSCGEDIQVSPRKTRPIVPSRKRSRDGNASKRRSMSVDSHNTSAEGGKKASASSSQSRPTARRNSGTIDRSEDLQKFIRGTNRKRELNDLTRSQRKLYNKHLTRATRYENMGRRKEALDSYYECISIFDGDENLISRLMALASSEGALRLEDFHQRPAKSPIRERVKRRKRSSKRSKDSRSSSVAEVIDLTGV